MTIHTVLRLDEAGDFDLTTGKIEIERRVGNVAAHRVRAALSLILGEWFLDVTQGTDYLSFLGGKGSAVDVAREVLRAKIVAVDEVKSLDSLTVTLEKSTRRLSVRFTATAYDDSTIDGGETFVVDSAPAFRPAGRYAVASVLALAISAPAPVVEHIPGVVAPTISSVSPLTAEPSTPVTVNIIGTNLTGATVSIGGLACTSVTVGGGGTTISCTSPATLGAGSWSVVVTTTGGTATYGTPFVVDWVAMVLSTQVLGGYFDADDATYTAPPGSAGVAWAGRASAGNSGSRAYVDAGAGYLPSPKQGTAYGGHAVMEFQSADPYPALKSSPSWGCAELLSLVNTSTAKSFTLAAVMKPLSGGTLNKTGAKVSASNPNIFGVAALAGLFYGTEAGVCKVGFVTYDDWFNFAYDGTTPIVWPGSYGTWGSIIAVCDGTSNTVTIYINGTANTPQTVYLHRTANGVAEIGTIGGGTYPTHVALRELYAFPRALTAADVARLYKRMKTTNSLLP